MKILALETSAKSVSVALTEDEVLLSSAFQYSGLTHSRTLMPMVQALLENAEMDLSQVDGFAVAAGPGSFTGLRIGISAVKGLAWSLDKPCCGVSTLEAMARNLQHMDAMLICAMDARRQQVYNALFDASCGCLKRLSPDRPIGLEELAEEVQGKDSTKNKIIVGDGAQLCYTYFMEHHIPCRLAPAQLRMQSAYGVALAALQGPWVPAQQLSPSYLRLSQAERERARRLALQEENGGSVPPVSPTHSFTNGGSCDV